MSIIDKHLEHFSLEKTSAERARKSNVISLSQAGSTSSQLKKLADLYVAKILTTEEFTAKKAEILARI